MPLRNTDSQRKALLALLAWIGKIHDIFALCPRAHPPRSPPAAPAGRPASPGVCTCAPGHPTQRRPGHRPHPEPIRWLLDDLVMARRLGALVALGGALLGAACLREATAPAVSAAPPARAAAAAEWPAYGG